MRKAQVASESMPVCDFACRSGMGTEYTDPQIWRDRQ